jgi:hypothetical protein
MTHVYSIYAPRILLITIFACTSVVSAGGAFAQDTQSSPTASPTTSPVPGTSANMGKPGTVTTAEGDEDSDDGFWSIFTQGQPAKVRDHDDKDTGKGGH